MAKSAHAASQQATRQVGSGAAPQPVRRIRSETRATLVASIARGRRWLDELVADATASAKSIAKSFDQDCVAADAVYVERVSATKFPTNRELTGKIAKLGANVATPSSLNAVTTGLFSEIPYEKLTGNTFWQNRETLTR
ncbi:MAG: hypothetical protein ACLPWG_19610 [Steroidobacteraceae bacterium]